jgi:hypothetical protein
MMQRGSRHKALRRWSFERLIGIEEQVVREGRDHLEHLGRFLGKFAGFQDDPRLSDDHLAVFGWQLSAKQERGTENLEQKRREGREDVVQRNLGP